MTLFRDVLIILLMVAGLYVGATWFFFGSVHPCGILEARQRPDMIRRVQRSLSEEMKMWTDLTRETNFSSAAVDGLANHLNSREQQERKAIQMLNWRISNQTPAECAWEAVRWRTPAPLRPAMPNTVRDLLY